MDSNQQGCLAEYLFATECLKRGIKVSMPLLHSSIYDCIIEVNGNLYKIQIKSTTKKPPRETISTIHIPVVNGRTDYNKKEIDYFAIYSFFFGGFFILKNTGKITSLRLSTKGKYKDNFNNFAFE